MDGRDGAGVDGGGRGLGAARAEHPISEQHALGLRVCLGQLHIAFKLFKHSVMDPSGVGYCPCPCPYNTMSNGRRCGGASAYRRAGGEGPLCLPRDVTPEMVERHRSGETW